MNRQRIALASAVALGLAVLTVLAACSKKSNPTAPGGGSGNTPFNSGVQSSGAIFARVFPTAGSVGYHCSVHGSAMSGSITISASDTTSFVHVTVNSNFYNPSSVTIKPGGTVHWQWIASNHSVTSN